MGKWLTLAVGLVHRKRFPALLAGAQMKVGSREIDVATSSVLLKMNVGGGTLGPGC